MYGATRSVSDLVSFVRISPAECFSAFSPAVCLPGVPMIVTNTSAIDRSGETFTRVIVGNMSADSRGSFKSRRMIVASSFWIVLASMSVRRLIKSKKIDLVINEADLRDHLHEIDQLAQR